MKWVWSGRPTPLWTNWFWRLDTGEQTFTFLLTCIPGTSMVTSKYERPFPPPGFCFSSSPSPPPPSSSSSALFLFFFQTSSSSFTRKTKRNFPKRVKLRGEQIYPIEEAVCLQPRNTWTHSKRARTHTQHAHTHTHKHTSCESAATQSVEQNQLWRAGYCLLQGRSDGVRKCQLHTSGCLLPPSVVTLQVFMSTHHQSVCQFTNTRHLGRVFR